MKRTTMAIAATMMAAVLVFVGCQKKEAKPAKAAFHIGVVTGTVSQSEDDLRGAEQLIKEYGAVKDGGMIQHITYPDNFSEVQETVISQIVGLSEDPLMKAIIVNQAVPGTAEAFRRIKEKHPGIFCIAGEAHEDPLVIEATADLVTNVDYVSRGYLIIWAAKELGAKTFVHISFPRHMSYETLGRRRYIMEQACKDLGLKFAFETAPDPSKSDVGVAGAQQFLLENMPQWIKKYGKDTAFFCTNDAHTEPLLKRAVEGGAMFIEADLPSPLMGYPGALGLDLSAEKGDFAKILKKVEEAVVAKGGSGRFGTWAFSYGFVTTAGLGEFAIRVAQGKAQKDSMKDMLDAYGKFTPGAKWNSGYNVDVNTGVRAKNHALVYMDTYIFGKGFLPSTAQVVPEKYFTIKNQAQ
ncbi:MAG TPA: DUF3798 domain-containing protein [Spirochaetales bacterium]|nr:DUF3798 domain-containing protein [Spirochaetales bacterium]HRZ65442.1 DUF3798 domain-containing protein [Spirochaetia bacterium]